MSKTYRINECFYSLQGEGVRAGTPNVFVRFSGCNLRCDVQAGPKSPGGFACDTEFESGRALTLPGIKEWVERCSKDCRWLILTGGEPGLQVDQQFVDYFHSLDYQMAIETNGTIDLSSLSPALDWITLSPKVAEHALKQLKANELKYVRGWGQGIPKPAATADHSLISPAASGLEIPQETLQWCIKLCLENPKWRLSQQLHKLWQVR